jgi:hypothetical protein
MSEAPLFLRGEPPFRVARRERLTAAIAAKLGRLVRERIAAFPERERALQREPVTRLVLACVVAMFAEATELLPPRTFSDALREADRTGRMDPIGSLFDTWGRRDPRSHGSPSTPYLHGPLFDGAHPRIALSGEQIHVLHAAATELDWQEVQPAILGSIFEQAFDVAERHELGAHFTREIDVLRVVGPTLVDPWRRRIARARGLSEVERLIAAMRSFHVLDPASGCGNFLYVAYREMKRLEAALADAWTRARRAAGKGAAGARPPPSRPYFTARQLHGIEKSGSAASLARVVLWIGEHLAKRELGLEEETRSIEDLEETILVGDALLVDWPRPAGELSIVGNPPYLGARKMRRELGDAYVEALFARYPENRAADYVTYWFTRALAVLEPGERAGFVATSSIAQNESREASIDRILAGGGTLTSAWKSYPWPGEAVVHVGILNWVMGAHDGVRTLEGQEVASISPALTEAVDLTAARRIPANAGLCFMGVTPGNSEFVLGEEERRSILAEDPGSGEVIKPFLVGRDVNREKDQAPTRWIIDFGLMERAEAEAYPGAFRHVRRHVYRSRHAGADRKTGPEKRRFWQFVRPRPDLRRALRGVGRVLVIPSVAPHLIVSRQESATCFDHQLMVVVLGGYYGFGVLQSRLHETWAWGRGSTLKGDLRYTNTTVFETFPFPRHPRGEYLPWKPPDTREAARVAEAAEAFDGLRTTLCHERDLGATKIHNLLEEGELPDLGRARDALDDAVTACYGFPQGAWRDERETLRLLLELNHEVAPP